ncbi:MAG: SMI1/KNR4 family protein [Archaeoglobus sp.]|nr:SMI1/KNR4 family protein [Archaeoglobus sp.]
MEMVEIEIPRQMVDKIVEKAVESKIREIEKRQRLSIVLPKELVDFLKKFCAWAGFDLNEYIEEALILDLESTIDHVRGTPIPKGGIFWEEIQRLKEKWVNGEL